MPYRVREILLVSSPYDAFILEEDGRLSERLFVEYSELNLPSAPRITHASSGARALELLSSWRFDLVITMVRLEDMDVSAFSRNVKAVNSFMPVVLLGFSEADLERTPEALDHRALDGIFVWTGDASILMAIVKLVEDRKNIEHDTERADVRVLLVVEDSVRRYSSFLTLLYAELMTQAASMIAEGVNELHKLMRMRARPKILLETSYEGALDKFERYRPYALGLITDVRFPKEGEENSEAGFLLVQKIRELSPDLPILIQSAEPEALERAQKLGVSYADKNSRSLHRKIRYFIKEGLGFGDFIFRLPDRTEVARARDMFELEEVLRRAPAESVSYHADHNHFSMWLNARNMVPLARSIRPCTAEQFGGVEGLREHIVSVLQRARIDGGEGRITNFSSHRSGSGSAFVRLGRGSIGGKARGIAFVNALLAKRELGNRFEGLEIRTPRTVAISTDAFDLFLERSGLGERAHAEGVSLDDFFKVRLPERFRQELLVAWREMRGPLSVRSSSLLEDAHFQPFAGIYATYKIPNNHPDPVVRFEELCRAVKAVYASTFSANARAYVEQTSHSADEEKMGVLVQEIVGQPHGDRFYPLISGVALSYNYYPVGAQRPEEGIALMALGLGHQVVSGGKALQFSPASPGTLPQFSGPADYLAYSQSSFFALDLTKAQVDFHQGTGASLVQCLLQDAEDDKTLQLVGSVYSPQDDVIRDNFNHPGPRLVTFNNILRWGEIPLASALEELLRVMRHGMGCPVELEFALNKVPGETPQLHILQVRPQTTRIEKSVMDLDEIPKSRMLCRSVRAMGHGVQRDLRHVLYVRRQDVDVLTTQTIANQIGKLNRELKQMGHRYVLVGPGRWGSSDSSLGIPVEWVQISNVQVIVEMDFSHRSVEPSQGSHFFHNITSMGIGYLTLHGVNREEHFIDYEWLDAQPAIQETEHLRLLELEQPLLVAFDGTQSVGVVLKPREEGSDSQLPTKARKG